jgi:hypothetical protein
VQLRRQHLPAVGSLPRQFIVDGSHFADRGEQILLGDAKALQRGDKLGYLVRVLEGQFPFCQHR